MAALLCSLGFVLGRKLHALSQEALGVGRYVHTYIPYIPTYIHTYVHNTGMAVRGHWTVEGHDPWRADERERGLHFLITSGRLPLSIEGDLHQDKIRGAGLKTYSLGSAYVCASSQLGIFSRFVCNP